MVEKVRWLCGCSFHIHNHPRFWPNFEPHFMNI
jgi:hypothetical protein